MIGLAVAVLAGAVVVVMRSRSDDQRPVAHLDSSSAAVSPTRPSTTGGPPVPSYGSYLGAWVYPRPFDQAGRVSSFTSFEKSIDHPLDIVHLYRTLGMKIGTSSDLAFARDHKYLLISWPGDDTRKIVAGHDDAIIAKTARQIAALPTQVFFEFRWEMDRANLRQSVHTPADYIAAWDHVRKIFDEQRVTNVAWTWCPTAGAFDTGTADAYYPGDNEVDWICADIYPKTPWQTGDYEPFPKLAARFMSWAALHPRKPVMIGEFAVAASYGARRTAWIAEAGRYVQEHPQIKAALWFEEGLPTNPSYYKWDLVGDPPALKAFAAMANTGYFGRRR